MAGDGDSLYTVYEDNVAGVQTLRRVDPTTGRVLATRVGTQVQPSASPQAGYVIAGRLWVLTGRPNHLTLDGLDLHTLATRSIIALDRTCRASAEFGGTHPRSATVYLACVNTVVSIDLARGSVVHRFTIPGTVRSAITPDGHRMYVIAANQDHSFTLYVWDPRTGHSPAPTRHYPAGEGIGLSAASNGGVWITTGSGMEYRSTFHIAGDLDRTTNAAGSAGGGYPVTVSVYPRVAWLGSTTKILCADPNTGTVRAAAPVGSAQLGQANIADFTVAGGRLFADFRRQSHDLLITLTPPSRCRP